MRYVQYTLPNMLHNVLRCRPASTTPSPPPWGLGRSNQLSINYTILIIVDYIPTHYILSALQPSEHNSIASSMAPGLPLFRRSLVSASPGRPVLFPGEAARGAGSRPGTRQTEAAGAFVSLRLLLLVAFACALGFQGCRAGTRQMETAGAFVSLRLLLCVCLLATCLCLCAWFSGGGCSRPSLALGRGRRQVVFLQGGERCVCYELCGSFLALCPSCSCCSFC